MLQKFGPRMGRISSILIKKPFGCGTNIKQSVQFKKILKCLANNCNFNYLLQFENYIIDLVLFNGELVSMQKPFGEKSSNQTASDNYWVSLLNNKFFCNHLFFTRNFNQIDTGLKVYRNNHHFISSINHF